MISTVTISTISTVTTVAAATFASLASIAAVITLIAFLTTRELASVSQSGYSKLVSRFLSVGIVPLVISFTAIVVIAVVEILLVS